MRTLSLVCCDRCLRVNDESIFFRLFYLLGHCHFSLVYPANQFDSDLSAIFSPAIDVGRVFPIPDPTPDGTSSKERARLQETLEDGPFILSSLFLFTVESVRHFSGIS
jgi:hypothetical protein